MAVTLPARTTLNPEQVRRLTPSHHPGLFYKPSNGRLGMIRLFLIEQTLVTSNMRQKLRSSGS